MVAGFSWISTAPLSLQILSIYVDTLTDTENNFAWPREGKDYFNKILFNSDHFYFIGYCTMSC